MTTQHKCNNKRDQQITENTQVNNDTKTCINAVVLEHLC